MIVWIEDPLKYSYLRKTIRASCSSRFPIKSIGKHIQDFHTLVGYELESKQPHYRSGYTYYYVFHWLKTYDRDIAPDGVYAGDNTYCGNMPCEAVDPKTLVMS